MVDTLDGRKIDLREVLSEPLRLFKLVLATLKGGRAEMRAQRTLLSVAILCSRSGHQRRRMVLTCVTGLLSDCAGVDSKFFATQITASA